MILFLDVYLIDNKMSMEEPGTHILCWLFSLFPWATGFVGRWLWLLLLWEWSAFIWNDSYYNNYIRPTKPVVFPPSHVLFIIIITKDKVKHGTAFPRKIKRGHFQRFFMYIIQTETSKRSCTHKWLISLQNQLEGVCRVGIIRTKKWCRCSYPSPT